MAKITENTTVNLTVLATFIGWGFFHPLLFCSGSDTGTASVRVVHCDASSATNVNVRVTNSANSVDDTAFNVRCVGAR